ncbi:MAG: putative DNA binding domain-containing protein [Bacteroidales bacterium]|nr:putative DNA binding domain-containing protein [Bacteroidales bacterium]
MEDYRHIFDTLLTQTEDEVVEFKTAESQFDRDKIGRYFSALSNEANLRDRDFAWIVLGVSNDKKLIGTSFLNSDVAIQGLKHEIAINTTGNLTFREIVPVMVDSKRILLFKIPASPHNIVTYWKRIAYGRDGESLVPLSQDKIDDIRYQNPVSDWSARIVSNATIDDLDELAVAKARIHYKKVHNRIPAVEIDSWDINTFLTNSGVMKNGCLTRAALILLGKEFSAKKLEPAIARVSWARIDSDGMMIDYEHFGPPFILTVDDILKKINNLTMRELPGGTLFPDTMKQYDDYTIREALHNCLAHQDYRLNQRINFVETPDYLYYSNAGTFIPGTIEDALEFVGQRKYYRNECLCQAMVDYNMIDTISRGIKTMYANQRERHFPMPDYQIDNTKQEVNVTIYGKVIDERYAQLLASGTQLSLKECIWLDAIQKHKPVTDAALKQLRARKLIEGRGKEVSISLGVAKLTHQVPQYTKNKGLAYQTLIKLILQLGHNAGDDGFKRKDAFETVENALPGSKTLNEKLRYLGRILVKMNDEGLLKKVKQTWYITSKGESELRR